MNQATSTDELGTQSDSDGLHAARRPWQLQTTGEAPAPKTWRALDRILDLFTDLGSLVVTTETGSYCASRDFHGDYTREVDELLAEIFRHDPAVTGVTFRWSNKEEEHTATAAAPYWLPTGLESARIDAAQARGEMTTTQAIEALNRLYNRKTFP